MSMICGSTLGWAIRWSVAAIGGSLLALAGNHPLSFQDLLRVRRVSDPQPSPDGRSLLCVVGEADLAANRVTTDLWWIPLASPESGPPPNPRRLTAAAKQDRHPRWSPDGKWIAFESNRDGEFQIYLLPTTGGEPYPLTHLATGATQPVWSPDGRSLAFVSSVLPEFSHLPFPESEATNRLVLKAREDSKVKARVLNHLLFRHWDSWVDGRRDHLFVLKLSNGQVVGTPRDVTPGDRDAVPTSSTFSAGDEFDFSPRGHQLAHTATPMPAREAAWKTDHEVREIGLDGPSSQSLTPENPAADGLPRYSPDGRFLAYRAQRRAGFEADRWELWLLELATGKRRSLTADFDASVENLIWARDSRSLFLEAEEKGARLLWSIPVDGGAVKRLLSGGSNGDLQTSADGKHLYFTRSTLGAPAEICRIPVQGGTPEPVTHFNDALRSEWLLGTAETVTVSGAGGTPVQMWILKPPGFDPKRRYPLVFWVHGGPQGAFLDSWSFRWNAQLWAAEGYVMALPNPRGSTGFGQSFTDEVSRDWHGRVIEDLWACVAHLEQLPWIDRQRMAAAGASFGGYVMNWFQGHTDKFRTLVTHCGVYNFETMYGTTEEVWFSEWECGVPWEDPEFGRHSPHRFAGKFKTPNLVIHNELDFRVPLAQGLDLFTALQRQNVPSKLLCFPDEGHWVLKPQNSELWHRTVFEWLATYLKTSPDR